MWKQYLKNLKEIYSMPVEVYKIFIEDQGRLTIFGKFIIHSFAIIGFIVIGLLLIVTGLCIGLMIKGEAE